MDDKLKMILRESSHLFIKYGLRSLSMDDLCREMGISKKTMYQYVENKTDLIERTLDFVVQDAVFAVNTATEEGCNAIDQLLRVSRKVCTEMQHFNPSITFDLQKYYPEIFRKFNHSKKEIIFNQIVENMRRGIAEGLYRDDLPVELVARLYVQKLEYINDPDFLQSEDFSFTNLFQVMFDNHIRGISNPQGLEYYEKQLQPSQHVKGGIN
ncbi:MAG: TetR/AcrR family transcriptional regulator [Bacteroidales bacterium]|nr:TetR/AcrR family transcriptional regulator [Bacteroidales bacterium]